MPVPPSPHAVTTKKVSSHCQISWCRVGPASQLSPKEEAALRSMAAPFPGWCPSCIFDRSSSQVQSQPCSVWSILTFSSSSVSSLLKCLLWGLVLDRNNSFTETIWLVVLFLWLKPKRYTELLYIIPLDNMSAPVIKL